MTCPSCSRPDVGGTPFCPHCGTRLAESQTPSPQPTPPSTPPRPGPARRPGLLIAGALVVAVGTVGVLKRGAGTSETGPGTPETVTALAISEDFIADDAQSIATLTQAAAGGNAQAMWLLGRLHGAGAGVPKDPARARALLEGASQTLKGAGRDLGYYLATGTGGPEDRPRSLQVLLDAEAANALRPSDLGQIGRAYANGWGTAVDNQKAAAYFRRAADAGDGVSASELGAAASGASRHHEAVEHWLKGARAGDGHAAFSLYWAHINGRGVAKDEQKALEWLHRAARQGHDGAQADLGYQYLSGSLERNDVEGLRWSLRAAERGNAVAQSNVGFVFFHRIYRVTNERDFLPLAYAFYNLSAAQNYEKAREERDVIEPMLNEEERLSAQKLAREFSAGRSRLNETEISGSGTAFWVSHGRLVTNEHVIGECAKLEVRTGQQLLTDVHVVAADADSDLALLAVVAKDGDAYAPRLAAISAADPALGEPVTAFGYPLSGVLSSGGALTNGSVSALMGMQDDPVRLQFSAPVQPGNSGGAILNEFAEVVGVVQAGLNPITQGSETVMPQNVNFGIKASRLRAFLQANGVRVVSRRFGSLDSRSLAQEAQRLSAQVMCHQSKVDRGLGR